MARFNRVYKLSIGKAGREGIEISDLRVTFDITKNTKEDPNECTIKIYNLSEQSRAVVETPDSKVILSAGYAEENSLIMTFAGAIVDAYTYFDQADVVTELSVADGYIELRDTAVSLGYAGGVKASLIINDIAKQMGLTLQLGDELNDRTWVNGFSHYGPARDALHKVVRGTGLEWSIQNQTLQVIKAMGTTRRSAVVLGADSGLIGYPKRNREGAKEKARVNDRVSGRSADIVSSRQQKTGWTVRSLLLPWINPGDLVKMESRTIQGFWRVDSLRHIGDSFGGDWQTELNLVEIK